MPAETHVARSPLGPEEVFALVRERLAEILEIDESRITRESRFTEDLDADSLALGYAAGDFTGRWEDRKRRDLVHDGNSDLIRSGPVRSAQLPKIFRSA